MEGERLMREGIRNMHIEEAYNRKHMSEKVVVYQLSKEEVERQYGHLNGSGVIVAIPFDVDVNGNSLSSDSAKVIRAEIEKGSTVKMIAEKYRFDEKHVKRIISLLKKERRN